MYNPTVASGIVELTVVVLYVLAGINAAGQGRRWFMTFLSGTLVGLVAEIRLVTQPHPRYFYTPELFLLKVKGVPIMIALGWGIVFFLSTLTAQRMAARASNRGKSYVRSLIASSLIAGALGVNIDLSLDAVAQAHGFWIWQTWDGDVATPNTFSQAGTMMGVPYDNFISWTVGIAVYGMFVRGLFHWVNRASRKDSSIPGVASLRGTGGLFWDLFIPLAGGVVASVAFVLLRGNLEWAYQRTGEALVFACIFLVALVAMFLIIPRGSREEDINWTILGGVAYFHLISFALLLAYLFKDLTLATLFTRLDTTRQSPELTPLLVLIPVNLVAGMLAYAWPSLEAMLALFPTDSVPQLPLIVRKTLASYGGAKVRALFSAPRNEGELRGLLAFAKETKRKVTFRGGGQAFDTQSLNDQLVLSLEGFDKIEVQADKGLVVVGCGAKWGKILEATLAHRLVPYIMVTSSAASAGGTLSSNSISRFSPSVGREGAHVAAFKLLTLDSNELIDCCDKPNSENFSTFLSVIGGLGYVGAVLEITYRLMPLAHENSMVKTKFTLVEGLRGVSGKLARTTDQRYRPLVKPFVDSVCGHCNVAKPQLPTPAAGAAAFSVAVNLRGSGWGLFAHSTYEKLATPLEKSIFHDPTSWRHILLQLAAMIPVLRKLGYWLAYRQYRGGEKAFTDPLHGYTFFEDGNRLVRRFLHALGLPAWLVQQTFMIPCDVSKPEESAAQLLHFLGEADGLFAEQKVDPALVDILYVGKDPHQFTLSSSRNMDAFAITFSFERMFTQPILEAAALRKLSEACLRLGGRVHLVKHVHADESTLCKMYGPAFKALHETRKERQSDQVLANEFSARVLTGI